MGEVFICWWDHEGDEFSSMEELLSHVSAVHDGDLVPDMED
jgi:hypothetical protein